MVDTITAKRKAVPSIKDVQKVPGSTNSRLSKVGFRVARQDLSMSSKLLPYTSITDVSVGAP